MARRAFALGAVLALMGCDTSADFSLDRIYEEAVIKGRPTLIVSITDRARVEFAFKLAGERFVVEPGRLHTILESDLIESDELWGGFAVYGELPDIAPYDTPEKVRVFRSPSTEHNPVRIALSRVCPTSVALEKCGYADFLKRLLSSSSYELLSHTDPVTQIDGLVPFSRRVSSRPTDHLYDIAGASSVRTEYIECDIDGSVPVPHCKHYFLWSPKIKVELHYKKLNVDQWSDIAANARAVIESMTSREPGRGTVPTISFPKDHVGGNQDAHLNIN